MTAPTTAEVAAMPAMKAVLRVIPVGVAESVEEAELAKAAVLDEGVAVIVGGEVMIEADELAEAEPIGTASVLVNASPVTPMTVCAIPAWREKVPSPVPQSHVPAAALGWQHQFWFPQDITVPSLALTGSSKYGVSPVGGMRLSFLACWFGTYSGKSFHKRLSSIEGSYMPRGLKIPPTG